MSITSRVNFFKSDANIHFQSATSLFGAQFDAVATPYFSAAHQEKATTYPFYNALKTLISAARIAKGCFLLLGSLVENPTQNIPQVFTSLCKEVGALLVNALNTVLSCALIVTRGLATLFNLGYTKKQMERAPESFHGSANMGFAIIAGMASAGLQVVEENIHQNTVTI